MDPAIVKSARACLALLLVAAWPSSLAREAAAAASESSVSEQARLFLRFQLSNAGTAPQLEIEGRSFRGSPDLSCFYDHRGFAPAWIEDSTLSPEVEELLRALAAAENDGLRPSDYHVEALERRVAAVRSLPRMVDLAYLDLLLSDAFLTFAAHLRNGKVNPEVIYHDCAVSRLPGDLAAALEEAVTETGVRAAFAGLAPPQKGYEILRRALDRYRRIAIGDAPGRVSPGPGLRLGDRGERVACLRAHLRVTATADAAEALPSSENEDLFDASLEDAARSFQRRHGLSPDGVAGTATLAEVNREPESAIRRIEINLERWRWLPRDLGRRFVLVNIAAFRLAALENDQTKLDMRIVVGKPFTRTPMFSSRIEAVVLNPSWYVPESIATQEILPKASHDPGFLSRGGYEVTGSRIRQKPGPQNALGQIKFVFPSPFGVYLHDTPARTLFGQTVRSFSHGCIRLEKPFELAVWVLQDDPRWPPAAIRAGIDAGNERKLVLRESIPVHVAYWTTWVDDAGTLEFGRDVYDRDAQLSHLLRGD